VERIYMRTYSKGALQGSRGVICRRKVATLSRYDSEKLPYESILKKIKEFKAKEPRPLSLAEKILVGHFMGEQELVAGKTYLKLLPGTIYSFGIENFFPRYRRSNCKFCAQILSILIPRNLK
jgi:hypothetical protein